MIDNRQSTIDNRYYHRGKEARKLNKPCTPDHRLTIANRRAWMDGWYYQFLNSEKIPPLQGDRPNEIPPLKGDKGGC